MRAKNPDERLKEALIRVAIALLEAKGKQVTPHEVRAEILKLAFPDRQMEMNYIIRRAGIWDARSVSYHVKKIKNSTG